MKYLREILLCVVLTAACSVATLHGGDSLSLKIMTYNLRFGEKASLEELAEAIRAQRPDLVALQEIDCRTRRPGVERQHDKDFVTELGLRTGMFPLYGKTIPHAGGWYGIGILTAGPYISVQKLMLPQASATEEPRALLLRHDRGRRRHDRFRLDPSVADARSEPSDASRVHRPGNRKSALPRAPRRRFQRRTERSGNRDDDPNGKDAVRPAAHLPGRRARNPARLPVGFPAGKWRLESTRVVPSEFSDHRAVVSVVTPVR